jgi:hypothetical protein
MWISVVWIELMATFHPFSSFDPFLFPLLPSSLILRFTLELAKNSIPPTPGAPAELRGICPSHPFIQGHPGGGRTRPQLHTPSHRDIPEEDIHAPNFKLGGLAIGNGFTGIFLAGSYQVVYCN